MNELKNYNVTNVKIEEKLFEAILSYSDFDKHYNENLHRLMDVIMELNINGVAKETLVDVLNQMLRKLDDKQFIQDAIIGEVLDYMTAWATPVANTKIYEFFVYFNPERMNVSEEFHKEGNE